MRGLTTALTWLAAGFAALTLLQVPAGFAAAGRYQRFHEELRDFFGSLLAGESPGIAPVQPTTAYSVLTGVIGAVSIALVVVLLLWTVRVRSNADVLAPGFPHRRSPLWAWLGWLVPAGALGVATMLQFLFVAAWVALFIPVVRGTAALQRP